MSMKWETKHLLTQQTSGAAVLFFFASINYNKGVIKVHVRPWMAWHSKVQFNSFMTEANIIYDNGLRHERVNHATKIK